MNLSECLFFEIEIDKPKQKVLNQIKLSFSFYSRYTIIQIFSQKYAVFEEKKINWNLLKFNLRLRNIFNDVFL